jgi:predicted DsbA family dithiol-disulfide isomerase
MHREMSMVDTAVLPVTVVSDVVCPWCFIGKRRLERAIARVPDIVVAVIWHPYFLNPWIPRAGISRDEYLTKKFGSVERYASISERVVAAAAAEGLVYARDKIARQPNTLDCHRLIHWAQEALGAGAAMKQRLMELYFSEGADLTDRDILVGAAAACGLDADAVGERLAGDMDVDLVTHQAGSIQEAGVSGVPCFIFGEVLAVSGAQSPDYLADAMKRAVDETARRPAQPAK